jgi:NADPH:quinone reductase-like Zn-dependent oxidoreductase
LRLGETTVICGAGPIGLIALAVAKASGAVPLIVTDVDAHRLEFAKTFVPSCETVLVPLESKPEEIAASILDTVRSLGAEQPRVVYECTGVQSSVITAAFLPRPKGEVMVVGVGRPVLNELPFMHLALAEVRSAQRSRFRFSRFSSRLLGIDSDMMQLDRSQIHQPLSSYVAKGNQTHAGWICGSQTSCDAPFCTRRSSESTHIFGGSKFAFYQNTYRGCFVMEGRSVLLQGLFSHTNTEIINHW